MRVFRSTNQEPMTKIKDKGRSFSKRNAGSRKEAMMSPFLFHICTPGENFNFFLDFDFFLNFENFEIFYNFELFKILNFLKNLKV